MRKPFVKDRSLSYFSSYEAIIEKDYIKKDIRREYNINGWKIELFYTNSKLTDISTRVLVVFSGCGTILNNKRHITFRLVKKIMKDNKINKYRYIKCLDGVNPEYSFSEKRELNGKKGKCKF